MDNNDLIKCSRISVDCVVNDPVDVKCGGPEYLGFDFNVKEEQTEEMQDFITTTLKKFEVPLESIYVSEKISIKEQDIWTKERIAATIANDAKYLQEEAAMNYSHSLKKTTLKSKTTLK